MKQIAPNYTYNKTTGVITLTGVNIDRDQLLLIVNTTRNVTYYNFADSATTLQAFTQGANTSLTLNSSVVTASSAHANGDALIIYYDDQASTVKVEGFNTAENFGTGVIQPITDADQDTIRSSLWIPVSSATNGTAGEGRILSQNYPMPVKTDLDVNSSQPCVAVAFDSPAGVQRVGNTNGFPIRPMQDGSGNSIPLAISGTVTAVDLGAKADAVATTDTGTFSVISLIKRGLQNWTSLLAKIPTLVSGRIPVDGSGVTQPVSIASVPSHAVTGPLTDTQLRATAVTSSVNNAGWKLLGSRNWNSDQSALMVDTTGYSELRFQSYSAGGVTSKLEVASPTGGEDYYWIFGNTSLLTFNHNVITPNQYVGNMYVYMTDWDDGESQTTYIYGRTSVSTITAYPPQGTTALLSNFTSVTATALVTTSYAGRTALTVFNEGPGTLYIAPYYIGPASAVSTTHYMVRLSAGDYWECPAGSLPLFYYGIFGSAGTARVTQIY